MIKVVKPFWSYDIKKTELWLSEMAKKGYLLVGLNQWTRCFFFQQGKSNSVTYRIGYDQPHGFSLSRTLVDEGWTEVIKCGKWYIISNEEPIEQIKTFSVRDGIIKRNRTIMYIFSGILIYLSGIAIFNLSLLISSLFQDVPVEVVPSPMWILTYSLLVFAIAIFVLSIYSVVIIKKTNKYLTSEKTSKLQSGKHTEGRLSKEKEKQLKLSGKMVVKRKPGWMYSPDRLEEWLENMERYGYNLYRVSRTGTAFYFIMGTPRNVSYCADYQNISNESYFDMHREAGWKSVFISYSSLQKWTIWSREFSQEEERPKIYSDKLHHLKHARKVAFAYTILFLPLVSMYILYLVIFIAGMLNNGTSGLSLLNTIMYLFCIIIFGSFTVRTWLYYMRLRNRYDFQL
ncbi:DUF2812 domain-containing protein [Robertmurraya yapensis]|uniref:DUF2812 domain-containing protein n=1 Tax=Bacillus yapensis TaxID=2492960 RepID=A0A3S0K4F4_9BACI|nr:DUF2812 domain-containing protein [Bacillus yapensis]RTR35393.1 DUF2812 domain-containing protein [Bacillus yapensis]TKS97902.1 DUF2812 domain-containing protein [Bacillus yapensis]